MHWDFTGALELQKEYPGRVKIIFYEDLKSDVEGKMKTLTDFIGMDYDVNVIKKYNTVKTNVAKANTPSLVKERKEDNAHWWRYNTDIAEALRDALIELAFSFITQTTLRRTAKSKLSRGLSWVTMDANYTRNKSESAEVVTGGQPRSPPKKKYDLLINSYMNSGSRFTGSLFGFRSDSFYFYEPLWNFHIWEYYHEPNHVCSSIDGSSNCRIENLVVSGVHDLDNLAGPSWAKYKSCVKARKPKSTCLKELEQICKAATHIVTKVLRITTGSLQPLLERKPNLKVIQLFRNPFAIINSRTHSKGYPVRDFTANAANLCKKMHWDFTGALELQKKYPGRVKIIFYEDLKSDVEGKMKTLTDFIGMDYDVNVIKKYNTVKTNVAKANTPSLVKERKEDNAHWWRHFIDIADAICDALLGRFVLKHTAASDNDTTRYGFVKNAFW
ncbi:hypothetical protein MAR_019795 [Mya arenaria]|uniref:Sulfotransferase domain-containing protein n=1 Tax=Mya arenaria TaxID=6604 RepID=A0ABY7E785_MYAAR|nr:hypothetical protein MAR_019795 [Mya arenaria]